MAYIRFRTEAPAASRMLELFGKVGGDVPKYFFLSRTHFAKIEHKKVIAKNQFKNLTAGVFWGFLDIIVIVCLFHISIASLY